MKTTAKHFLLKAALVLGLVLPGAAQGQSPGAIPLIEFHNVSVSTAIENLAHMTDMNYFIEPNLFTSANGNPMPEPALNLHWENYTAANALARVLKENHLFMVTNDYTTVVHFTSTPIFRRTVDTALLGRDTNAVIPYIRFTYTPLDMALKSIVPLTHRNIALDPEVSEDAPPQPPNNKIVMMPTVSVNWKNLTPYQVIVEICEAYGLVIVKGSAPNSFVIKYKK